MIHAPLFTYANATQHVVANAQDDEDRDFGPLFSLSPFTSPVSTPSVSPIPSRYSTPTPTAAREIGTPSRPSRTEGPSNRKAKERAKARRNEKAKKQKLRDATFSHHKLRSSIAKNIIGPSRPIVTPMGLAKDARVVGTGYSGINDHGRRGKGGLKLEDLVGEGSRYGFTYISWDGTTPTPLVSQDGYICGVLAGNPDPIEWPNMQKSASQALEDARARCSASREERNHRRGRFTALRCGLLHGNGTKQPVNAHNSAQNASVLAALNALEPFKRLSGFATSVMASWAPKLHAYYTSTLESLHASDAALKRLFPTSVFTTATYNLGPQTVCNKHTDFLNLAFGWCAVTALGSFDPKLGGHLILWDLHLVIEFPPGATALIPSAIVAHSNTAVGAGEKRYSFTQYTPAGLFRWVDNGFRTADALSPDEKEKQGNADASRWRFGLSLTPKVDEVGILG